MAHFRINETQIGNLTKDGRVTADSLQLGGMEQVYIRDVGKATLVWEPQSKKETGRYGQYLVLFNLDPYAAPAQYVFTDVKLARQYYRRDVAYLKSLYRAKFGGK